jgi:hypothetical protein
MEPDRARCVRQRVGARQPVQQRLPPRGRAARCASSRGRCGPVRERRRASNGRVSGGAHGSARRLLVRLAGVLEIDFARRTSVSSTRRGCFTARVRRVRRRIDDVSIVQRCVSNLSRGTGGLARSVGEARMIDGRGVEIALFRGVADAGSTQLWLVERIGNQCGAAFRNSQINSDRGDPPFLIWRGTDTSDSRGYGSSFLPLDLDQRFTSPVVAESSKKMRF